MKLMRTPRKVDIEISSKCNLRCKYCAYFDSPSDVSSDLPLAEWLTFFEELKQNAVLSVTLGGGEPLCRPDILEVVDGAVRNRLRFGMLTNGILVTKEIAAYLVQTKRCDFIQVSIDGPDAQTHESIRGKGTFEGAVRGLEYLRACGAPVTVRVTVNKQNVYELDRTAAFLLETLKLPSFTTNSAFNQGLFCSNSPDLELSVEEYSFAMKELLRLEKKYDGRITAAAGPLVLAKQWRSILEEGGKIESCGCLSDQNGCGAVFSLLAVRADGVIIPCLLLNHIELGRINQVAISDLWHKHPELIRLRTRKMLIGEDNGYCSSCSFRPRCAAAACPAASFYSVKNDADPAKDLCLKRFLDAGGQVPTSSSS